MAGLGVAGPPPQTNTNSSEQQTGLPSVSSIVSLFLRISRLYWIVSQRRPLPEVTHPLHFHQAVSGEIPPSPLQHPQLFAGQAIMYLPPTGLIPLLRGPLRWPFQVVLDPVGVLSNSLLR